jgi:hypothetical protein
MEVPSGVVADLCGRRGSMLVSLSSYIVAFLVFGLSGTTWHLFAAMFLFAAGQDTSAKLLSNAMRRIAEDPVLQQQLRADHSLIPPMLEEVLRLEGSTKVTFEGTLVEL